VPATVGAGHLNCLVRGFKVYICLSTPSTLTFEKHYTNHFTTPTVEFFTWYIVTYS
jgi:hypothetical protein